MGESASAHNSRKNTKIEGKKAAVPIDYTGAVVLSTPGTGCWVLLSIIIG